MAKENVLIFALQIELYSFDMLFKEEWLKQNLITVKEEKLFEDNFEKRQLTVVPLNGYKIKMNTM